jgi:hypothetical protein
VRGVARSLWSETEVVVDASEGTRPETAIGGHAVRHLPVQLEVVALSPASV